MLYGSGQTVLQKVTKRQGKIGQQCSVSGAAGSFKSHDYLTMAFLLAIFRVPRARQVVMTAGKPSGMAATASATAILK